MLRLSQAPDLDRVLGHLIRQLAPLDFMLERPIHDKVNERGGPKLDMPPIYYHYSKT